MMERERYLRVKELFLAAARRAPGDRPAFLDDACAGDSRLRAEVEALLESDQAATAFLAGPARSPPPRRAFSPSPPEGPSGEGDPRGTWVRHGIASPRIFEELPPYREALARGDWKEAMALIQRQAGPQGELPPDEALALAELHRLQGKSGEATLLLEGLARHGEPRVAVAALVQLALLRLTSSPPAPGEAEALLDKARPLAPGDARLEGLLAHARAQVDWKRGRVKEAGEWLEEARSLLEEGGDDETLARVLDSLALYHEHMGERERALSSYSLSLSKKALCRDLYGIAITLGNLGRFHLRMGEPRSALSCLTDDLRIAEKLGDLSAQVVVRTNIGQALTRLGRLAEAQELLEETLALARQGGFRTYEVFALKDLARVVASRGDSSRAAALLDEALALTTATPPSYARGQVLLTRGELSLESGDLEAAARAYEEARETFTALEARQEEALAVHGLASIAERRQDWNSCTYHLEAGMRLLSTVGFALANRFEESFRRLQAISQDRAIPRSVGPYRVISRLGGGTYGDVYKAFDEREGASRESVAVKVLRLEGTRNDRERQDRLARFRREAQILARLSHPHVVRLIEQGEDPPYLVEEYLGGGDLTGLLGKALAPPEALKLMRGVFEGLTALHAVQVVHRDLKPANILLRENGEAVIADFGISRLLDVTALTMHSVIMGTLAYMAPEQLRSEPVDERADLYSTGALFYELLSGRLPHDGRTPQEVIRSIEKEEPPDLMALRPSLPAAMGRCIMRCLAKSPEERLRTAREALALLEEAP